MSSWLLFFYPIVDAVESVKRLCQLAEEVRIFPLCNREGKRAPELPELEKWLTQQKFAYRYEDAGYGHVASEWGNKRMVIDVVRS